MNKKILWLAVSSLLVVALVLASCGPAVPGEQEEEEEEEEPEPAVGEPQYGGTLTYLSHGGSIREPTNPDISAGFTGASFQWLFPMMEMPFVGDIEKYGPRGTNEFAFQVQAFIPIEFLRGRLLESWEVTHEELVWHIRPGIYWAPNEKQSAWMEAREFTAQDMVADLLIFYEAPGAGPFRAFATGEIYATDGYTLHIKFSNFDSRWFYYIGYEDRSMVSPPEMEIAGPERWENQVGTGPFIFKEYVEGSHMSYSRNPNWWKTTTIKGVEYPVPFIDELVIPMVLDISTQMAALRTGVFHAQSDVEPQEWASLAKTSPELLSSLHVSEGRTVGFRCNQPPFDNVDIRRALMIGTDLWEFHKLAGVADLPLPLHWFPAFWEDPTIYTPLEELPAECRLLYDYNPELAIKMLADAGYPDGLELTCNLPSVWDYHDIGALLKSQWDKIGVTVNLNAVENVAIKKLKKEVSYLDVMLGKTDPGNPIFTIYRDCMSRPAGMGNYADWSNEDFDELMDFIGSSIELAEQAPAYKEAALIVLEEVPYIPLTPYGRAHYWWPWIKNYYGEWNCHDNPGPYWAWAFSWLDLDLKKEMGY